MHGDITPEFNSLMLHADVSQRMLLARDAAMAGDGKRMMNWLDQARQQYQEFIAELVKMCEALPR